MPAAWDEFTANELSSVLAQSRWAADVMLDLAHDLEVKLRHLTQIRHATCTGPGCRRPSTQADFEHNIPYEAGGRTCLCNGGPKCRHDHRLKWVTPLIRRGS